MSSEGLCVLRRNQKPSPPPLNPLRMAPDTSNNNNGGGETTATAAPRASSDTVKRSASPPAPGIGEPDSSAAPRPPKCAYNAGDEVLLPAGGNSPQLLNAAEVGRVFADLELEIGAASTTLAAEEEREVRRTSSTYAYPIELDAILAAAGAPEPESSTADVRLEEPTVSEAPPAVLLEPSTVGKLEPQSQSPSSTSSAVSPVKPSSANPTSRPRPRIPKLGFTFINLTGEDPAVKGSGRSSGAASESSRKEGSSRSVTAAFKRKVRAQPELAGVSDAVVLEKLSSIARPPRPAFRKEFPRWRERPEVTESVVDLVASDNDEESPVVPAKVSKKEKAETPVRRKMRAGFDAAWPPTPPPSVVDLVDEEEPAEAAGACGPEAEKESARPKASGDMRALEFVYPRTTAEFYRALRGETVSATAEAPTRVETKEGTEETDAPHKKLRLTTSEEAPVVSDADKLSSIVEEMEIGEHRVVAGKEKAAIHGDKAEVEAMEVDYIPELETLRKEMIRTDRELLVPPLPTVSEVESMEVETTTPLDAGPVADAPSAAEAATRRAEAVEKTGADATETKAPLESAGDREGRSPAQPVMAGLKKKSDEATSSMKELTESKTVSRAEPSPEASACSSSSSGGVFSSSNTEPQTKATTPLQHRRRRWRSLSDIRSVRDALIGTSPVASRREDASEPRPACRCFADRETATRCTQTDHSFCVVSILPTTCAQGLSSAFISSTTASSLGVALNLTAFDSTQTGDALSLSPKRLAGGAVNKVVPTRRTAKRSVSESAALDGESNAVVEKPGVLRRASSLALLG